MNKILFMILFSGLLVNHFVPPEVKSGAYLGLNLQNIVVYTVLLITLFFGVANGKIRTKKITCGLLLVLILIIGFLSILYSQALLPSNLALPLKEQIQSYKLWIFDPFIFFCLAFLISDSSDDAKFYLKVIVILFGVLNLINVVYFFISPSDLILKYNRFSGFGNANKTAYLMCFLMPFSYYFLLLSKKRLVKLIYFFFFLFPLVNILVSASRGGLLSFIFIMIALSVMQKNFKLVFVIVFFVMIGIVSLWGNSFFQHTIERTSVLFSGDMEAASNHRFDIWRNLFGIYFSNPAYVIFGTGVGTASKIGGGAEAHNMYFKVIIEFGLMGISLWTLLLVKMFKTVIFAAVNDENKKFKYMLCISMISIAFIAWLFTSLGGILTYLSLILGLSLAVLNLDRKEKMGTEFAGSKK